MLNPGTGALPESRATGARFGALRSAGYRSAWTGNTLAELGVWSQRIALAWVAAVVLESTTAAGILLTLSGVASLAAPVVGGALADRADRRRTLIFVQGGQAVLLGVLATLLSSGALEMQAFLTIAGLASVLAAAGMPSRLALIGDLVEPDDVLGAAALYGAGKQAAAFSGSLLVGLSAGLLGNSAGAGVAALLLAGSAVAFSRVPAQRSRMPEEPYGVWAPALASPSKPSIPDHSVWAVVALAMIAGACALNYNLMLPTIARELWDGPRAHDSGTLLMASVTAGAVGLVALAAVGHRLRSSWVLLGAMVALGLAVSSLPGVTTMAAAVPRVAAVSAFAGIFTAAALGAVLLRTRENRRGWALGWYSAASLGGEPVARLVVSQVAAASFSLSSFLIVSGAVVSVSAVLAVLTVRGLRTGR